jgi:hypothetical protein
MRRSRRSSAPRASRTSPATARRRARCCRPSGENTADFPLPLAGYQVPSAAGWTTTSADLPETGVVSSEGAVVISEGREGGVSVPAPLPRPARHEPGARAGGLRDRPRPVGPRVLSWLTSRAGVAGWWSRRCGGRGVGCAERTRNRPASRRRRGDAMCSEPVESAYGRRAAGKVRPR